MPTPQPRSQFSILPDALQAVKDGLWLVVNGERGTARRSKLPGKDLAGKTGTAQVISLDGARVAAGKMDVRDHGFFVFFAPRDNPQIAGIVFAEHGLHGSSAAPLAKHVVDTFFAKQEGRPLPVWPAASRRHAGRGAATSPSDRGRHPSTQRSEPRNLGTSGPRNPGTPNRGTADDRRTSSVGPPRLAAGAGRRGDHARRAVNDLLRDLERSHQSAGRRVLDAGLRAADRARRDGRLSGDRLPGAHSAVALHLRRARPCARVCLAVRRRSWRRPPVDRPGRVLAAAFGVRAASRWRSCSRCSTARAAAARAR